jgi:hypothetical protein
MQYRPGIEACVSFARSNICDIGERSTSRPGANSETAPTAVARAEATAELDFGDRMLWRAIADKTEYGPVIRVAKIGTK